MDENQIILIDKPANISSFGVVAKVRGHLKSVFGRKVKVGHTGTLDPFATGLLIILTGKNTKKSSEFLKLDKVYEATLKLGFTSTTGDPEGKITEYQKTTNQIEVEKNEKERETIASAGDAAWGTPSRASARMGENAAAGPAEKDINLTIKSFLGTIIQTPPRFSAIKVGGQRAYKLARNGQDFEIPSREVEIYSIDVLSYHYPELKIRVHCSSGTYIRTLAEDIGKALNTGAYLTALRRTKIGDFSISDAKPLSDFTKS